MTVEILKRLIPSSLLKLATFLTIAATICASQAHASYQNIFYEGGPYNSVSGYETINLNDYGTSIESITVWADAYGYEPGYHPPMNGDNQINPEVAATIYLQLGSLTFYHQANVHTYGGIFATNIVKNQNGHWIAAQISSPGWTQYNVDLGTGSLDLLAWAQANGYAYCNVSAEIVY